MNVETGTFLGRVPFASAGARAGAVVVVSGGQAFVQRPTPERMARDARRIARLVRRDFILVGHDATSPRLGADLAAILAELGGAREVVAISYGGPVALRAAAERPELFARLTLLSSAHDFSAEGKRRLARQIELAERGDLVGLVGEYAGLFRRPWLNWLLGLRLRTARARLVGPLNDPALIVRGLRAVLEDPLDPSLLARVTAPCVILGGTRDQFFGDGMMQRTASLLRGATLELWEGETHMVAVERAGPIAKRLAVHETNRARAAPTDA